ncbi:MAG: ubiquinone/menaquinone biosynthesis methyltransferase [Opitutaceae bacterium]
MTKPDPAAVRTMFGRIAPRYDLANRLLSAGLDRGWRTRLAGAVRRAAPASVLDVATGSGDVAFTLARSLPQDTAIVGIDFCLPMLEEAERKRRRAGPGAYSRVRFQNGDALKMDQPDAAYGAVTIAFGLRNLPDRARFFAEALRVLRPEGTLFVLEFSQPAAWFRPVYFFYLRRILPAIGGWLAGDREAYRYLDATIEAFPDRGALAEEMRRAGFARVEAAPLAAGSVALHVAAKGRSGRIGD